MPTIEDVDAYIKSLEGQAKPEDLAAYRDKLISDYNIKVRPKTTEDKILESIAPVAGPLGKVLDYPGGIARTTAAALLTDNVGLGDVARSIVAEPLSGDEILKRIGVPQGGSLSDVFPNAFTESGAGIKLEKGGPLDVTARGAGGVGLEVALDPLTYATLGGSGVIKEGLESVAKKTYKTAVSGADEALKELGKGPLSDVLYNYNIRGSGKGIRKKTLELSKDLKNQSDNIINEAAALGAQPSVQNAVSTAQEKISAALASQDPILRSDALKMQQKINEYLNIGKSQNGPYSSLGIQQSVETPGLKQVNKFKESLNKALKEKDFQAGVSRSSFEKEIIKDLSQGFRKEVADAANIVNPGSGDLLNKINADRSTILSSNKELKKIAKKQLPIFTSVDAGLLTAGLADPTYLAVFAAKKARDLSKFPITKTTAGSALKTASDLFGTINSLPKATGVAASTTNNIFQELLDRDKAQVPYAP